VGRGKPVVQDTYQSPGDGVGMTMPTAALRVAADHSALLDGDLDPVILRVSPRTLAARHWPGGRPGPLPLERAIEEVEDAIERSGLRQADRGVLHATASLRPLLPQRLAAPATYRRDEVEAEFSRLVASSHAAGLGTGLGLAGETAAALLLLRELMHQLGFQAFSTAA
jgi:hypothetical protein